MLVSVWKLEAILLGVLKVSVSGVKCGEAEAPIGQEEAVDPLHLIKGREQD